MLSMIMLVFIVIMNLITGDQSENTNSGVGGLI